MDFWLKFERREEKEKGDENEVNKMRENEEMK